MAAIAGAGAAAAAAAAAGASAARVAAAGISPARVAALRVAVGEPPKPAGGARRALFAAPGGAAAPAPAAPGAPAAPATRALSMPKPLLMSLSMPRSGPRTKGAPPPASGNGRGGAVAA